MSSNRPLRLAAVPIAAAALGLVAACATPTDHRTSGLDQAVTPTEQYPLKVAETPREIRLAPHPAGLSPAQREALAALADRWLQEGGGPVTIRTPSAGADPAAAGLTSVEAAEFLRSLGVPGENIRRVGYDASRDRAAPIIVAYSTFRALIPRCGTQWENLSTNADNKPMENFGCAVSANMAAEIADPADIVGPRATDPTDAGRRTTVIDKYRQGQATAGASDSNASGTISSIGSGGGGP